MKEGRTDAQIEELHRRLAQVVAEVTGVPIERVRTYITQFPATAWGIGGKSADDAPIAQSL